MAAQETVSVPGSLAGVHQAIDAFEAWSDGQGVPAEARRSLFTSIDEILSNIVRHGLQGQAGEIDLVFSRHADAIAIEVVDRAAPFNPLLASAPDTTAPLEERQVGGLGIALVRALVDDVCYERREDRNHLTITWRL
jgi:serine/threonine-protein kinase RsbW